MTAERSPSDVLVVIPARYGSTRFPGKALADLEGAPLIVRVIQNASQLRVPARLVVATDDERIREAVVGAGFACEMTADHPTGTDRVGEVATRLPGEIIVNLQGDEPLLDPADVDALVDLMRREPDLDIGTCAHRFADAAGWRDPNVVKVVRDRRGRALYFSRAAIPGRFPGSDREGHRDALRHVGIYAFRRPALERFLDLPRTSLELTEGLEQLRALEHGLSIGVQTVTAEPVGVDTPADLELVRRKWRERGRP